MGYKVVDTTDMMRTKYEPRKGLEGPFHYPNGQVLYYDPKAGEYYDPTTDFYVSNEDVAELQNSIFALLAKH
jgi:hypothetical protein